MKVDDQALSWRKSSDSILKIRHTSRLTFHTVISMKSVQVQCIQVQELFSLQFFVNRSKWPQSIRKSTKKSVIEKYE